HAQGGHLVGRRRLERRQPLLREKDEDAPGQQERQEEADEQPGRDARPGVQTSPEPLERQGGHCGIVAPTPFTRTGAPRSDPASRPSAPGRSRRRSRSPPRTRTPAPPPPATA